MAKKKKKIAKAKILVKKVLTKKKLVKPVKKILVKKNKSRGVIPAKAGIQKRSKHSGSPIRSGMTKRAIVKKVEKKKSGLSRRLRAPRNDGKIIKKQPAEFQHEELFKARIKVVGIGGGGGSIVSEIGRSLEKATFVIADTDIRALKKKSGIKYFWFGEELTHGLGTGVNVDLAKQAAERAKEKISGFFKDQDIVIFIASLGGGLGSGATQIFAEAAKEFGGITFGIFTLPFKFEGKNKQRIAQNALKTLRQSLNVSLVIPNEKIFKIIDINTPITQAFSIVNKSLIESLESLIDLIYNPGIINIDFADLRTILKGRGNTAFLNTIEESGKDRAEKICQRILQNPLLQNSNIDAEKILFNIAGSENLSMFEVEKVSSHISKLNPKSKIIFGISKNPKLKNKIKTTILMTGGSVKEEEIVEKTEEIVEVAEEPIKNIGFEKPKPKIKIKKPKSKKPEKKVKPKKPEKIKKIEKPVLAIPVFEVPEAPVPVFSENKLEIIQADPVLSKKTIRRSGLEIKKAEELQEKKRIAQEKEWEIPAFLRRAKYKS